VDKIYSHCGLLDLLDTSHSHYGLTALLDRSQSHNGLASWIRVIPTKACNGVLGTSHAPRFLLTSYSHYDLRRPPGYESYYGLMY